MEAGTEEVWWGRGAQSLQEQLGEDYGEHIVAPQAHERYEGTPLAYVV